MNTPSVAIGPDSRLLLIDGHSLAYRAFYALPVENFQSPDGVPTNAIHGFVSMMLQVVESEAPTHVAVAFDVSRDTFRRAEFPEYKAQRAKSPVEFSSQVPLIREVLTAFGITHVAVEGFEADDIIATLATAASAQGAEVLILTGDRDSLQLVNEKITVLYPVKGVKDLARMTPEAVESKYLVRPDQYADYAAIRGDSSDNLPSIPGVGEKTAATWLKTYGSLTGILDAADEIKGKVGESLRAHAAQVLLNRRLTQLVHDVPLDVDVNDLHRHVGNAAAIGEIFDRLGFRTLRKRALSNFTSGETVETETAAPETPVSHAIAFTVGALGESLSEIPQETPVALAYTEVSLTQLSHIALSWNVGHSVFNLADLAPHDLKALGALFEDEARTVVVHGSKPLFRWLSSLGVSPVCHFIDTELVSYLMNPGLRGLDLASCVERLLHRDLHANEETGLFADEAPMVRDRAIATLAVFSAMQLNETAEFVTALHDELELPTARVLAEMERIGIAVSVNSLTELSEAFAVRMQTAEKSAHHHAGREFNLGSPKQLQEILFEIRGLPKTKKIKTGYTTDAEALSWLAENTGDPVVTDILSWREVTKLRQTVVGLLPLVDDQGRIHTTFSQTVAATGRLSSADPNLQNIPVRTEEGRLIRAAFVKGSEYDALMTADYSQIEMRIMAHLSDDEGLIAAFNSGEDLHTTVAANVFGVSHSDVTPDMRRRIKAMSYGLAYGLSSYGLSAQLGIEPREATALMESYFSRFGGVQRYLKNVVVEATRVGYTETMFGRRRYLPDLSSPNQQLRAVAERMALNAPIQGTAADIMKRAMLAVHDGLVAAGLKSRLLLQVHDELVLEIVESEREEVEKIVRDGMASAADLKVALDVSVGVGPNWDAAAH